MKTSEQILVVHAGILCLVASLTLSFPISAQSTFSYYYPFDSYGSTFRTLLVDNDTILLQGYFQDTASPFLQGMAFAKVDSSGNLITYQRYFDPKGRDLTYPPLNNIIKLSDGRFLTVSISFQDDALQLVFLTSEFIVDTIFEYFADDPTVQVNWIRSVFELPDGYLVFGSAQRLTYATDGQIFRINKEGQLLWRKWYGIPNKDEAFGDVIQYSDSSFIVSSYHKPFPVASQDKRSNTWIFEVDVNGNILNEYINPDPFSGGGVGLVIDDFNSIYYAGVSIVEGMYGEHNALGRIGMLDSDFELQWKNEFGKNLSINTGLTDMIRTGTKLIAVGTYVDTITIWEAGTRRPHLGLSAIVSTFGDSICQTYDTAQWYTHISSYGRFRSMDTLSTGSIISCGEGRFGPEDNYHEFAWLVKMPNPPCESLEVGTDDITPLKPNWAALPNPVSETIIIIFDDEATFDRMHFNLFNIEGRIVRRFNVDVYSAQIKISIHDLPNGTYILQSIDNYGRLTGFQKLVVLH